MAENGIMPYFGGISGFNSTDLLTQRLAYNGDGNPEYIGYAVPGSDEAQAVWMVKKILYNEAGNPSSILFANGDGQFNQKWSDRATLNFS